MKGPKLDPAITLETGSIWTIIFLYIKANEVLGGDQETTWDEVVAVAMANSSIKNSLKMVAVFLTSYYYYLPLNAFLMQKEYFYQVSKPCHVGCFKTPTCSMTLVSILLVPTTNSFSPKMNVQLSGFVHNNRTSTCRVMRSWIYVCMIW